MGLKRLVRRLKKKCLYKIWIQNELKWIYNKILKFGAELPIMRQRPFALTQDHKFISRGSKSTSIKDVYNHIAWECMLCGLGL